MPISRLGYVKDGEKIEFPVISALPREMTMAEFALLSDEEKMGDIIVTDYPVNEESDYVEVVADGVKTNATLLNELFALVDRSRTNQGSVLIRNGIFHYCIQAESSVIVFTSGYVDTSASGSLMVTATLQASNSKLEVCKLNGTYTNNSSSVPTIGSTLRIYYNDAHTFDFNTKAENCIFDPTGTSLASTNAEDAIKEVVSTSIPGFISKNIYRSDTSNSVFTLPLTIKAGNRAFIVLTRYGMWWGTVYNSGASVQVSALVTASDSSRTLTPSYNNTTEELTLTFSGGMFGGITVFY